MIGKKLAHYEIIEKIGQGGMGEVYRARDTKLGREAAIKVLPPMFAQDVERLGRFKREAKLLASLNHANIATLYGLEEDNGQHFLAMELISGEDLSDRIARGAIPLKETLNIIRNVADALQNAHGHGIVHRDLKPANIKVNAEGQVKVLDFGLAKALESDAGSPNMSQSPTIATVAGTMGGVILGTAAYMSPEQARGKPVDKLTDVWALGCVLFEMLTRARAFPGETVSDTIAKILEREPDWNALPADTPQTLQRLVRRCLQKDKSMRLQDVGEIRVEVDGILSGASESWTGPVAVAVGGATPAPRGGVSRAWVALALVAVVASAVFAAAWLKVPADEARVVRTSITQPTETRFVSLGDYAGPVVVSPDARRVAFVANNASLTRMLFVRELDALEAVALPGTDGATFPFWSPDGRSLGYFTDTRLMRVELSGGLPITVCPAANGRGGSWSRKGEIVFSPDFQVGIHRVPASGGIPVAVTALDTTMHSTHRWPVVMPDGEHFVYVAAHHDVGLSEYYGVYFASIDGSVNRRLIASGASTLYASGYLLYLRENTLMAAEFDPVEGVFTDEPMAMIDKVQYDPTTWYASFSVSQSGMLAYHGAGDGGLKTRLVVIDRDGKETAVIDETDVYYHLSISPDGKRLACTAGSAATLANTLSIWLYEIENGRRTRLSFSDGADISPVWSPDGKRIAYSTIYPGSPTRINRVTVAMTDGGGEEVIIESDEEMWLTGWSHDGRYIVYTEGSFVSGGGDIWIVPMFGDRKPFPFLATDADEDGGMLSPDGRWMVYTTREQGQMQVFVAPFAPPAGSADGGRGSVKWQISTDVNLVEGTLAKWRSDGKEILFLTTDGKIWSAEVDGSGNSFHVGRVEMLCTSDPWNFGRVGFDITPDGDGFVVNSFSKSATPPITLVQNWTLDLKR